MALSNINERTNKYKKNNYSIIESHLPNNIDLLNSELTSNYNFLKSLKTKDKPLDITVVYFTGTDIENVKDVANLISDNSLHTDKINIHANKIQLSTISTPADSEPGKDNKNIINKEQELTKLISNSNYTIKVQQEEKQREIQYIRFKTQLDKNKLKFQKESFSFLNQSHQCMVYLLGDYYPLKIIGGIIVVPIGFIAVSNIMNPATLSTIVLNIFNKPYLFNWFLDFIANLGILTPKELQSLQTLYANFINIYNSNPLKYVNNPELLKDILTNIFNSTFDKNDVKNKDFVPFINVFQNLWSILKIKKEGFEELKIAYDTSTFIKNDQITYVINKINNLITNYDNTSPEKLLSLNENIKNVLEELIKVYPKNNSNIKNLKLIINHLIETPNIALSSDDKTILNTLYTKNQEIVEANQKHQYFLELSKEMIKIRDLFSTNYDKTKLLEKLEKLKNNLYAESGEFIELFQNVIEYKSDQNNVNKTQLESKLQNYIGDDTKINDCLDSIINNTSDNPPIDLILNHFKPDVFSDITTLFNVELAKLKNQTDYLIHDLLFKDNNIFKQIDEHCKKTNQLSSNLISELNNILKNINLINVNTPYKSVIHDIIGFRDNNTICDNVNRLTINKHIQDLINNNNIPSPRGFSFDFEIISQIRKLYDNPMIKSLLSSVGLVRYIYGHITTTEQILLNAPNIDKTIVLKSISKSIVNSFGTKQLYSIGSQMISPYVSDFTQSQILKPLSNIFEYIFNNQIPETIVESGESSKSDVKSNISHILYLLESGNNPLNEISKIVKENISEEIKNILKPLIKLTISESDRENAIDKLNKIVVEDNIAKNIINEPITTDIKRYIRYFKNYGDRKDSKNNEPRDSLYINHIRKAINDELNSKSYYEYGKFKLSSLQKDILRKLDKNLYSSLIEMYEKKPISKPIDVYINNYERIERIEQMIGDNYNSNIILETLEILKNYIKNDLDIDFRFIKQYIDSVFLLLNSSHMSISFKDKTNEIFERLKEYNDALSKSSSNNNENINTMKVSILDNITKLQNYISSQTIPLEQEFNSYDYSNRTFEDKLYIIKKYYEKIHEIVSSTIDDSSKKALLRDIDSYIKKINTTPPDDDLEKLSDLIENIKDTTSPLATEFNPILIDTLKKLNESLFENSSHGLKMSDSDIENIDIFKIQNILKQIFTFDVKHIIDPSVKKNYTEFIEKISKNKNIDSYIKKDIIDLKSIFENVDDKTTPPPEKIQEISTLFTGLNTKIDLINKFSGELAEMKNQNLNDPTEIKKCIYIICNLFMKQTNQEEYNYVYDKIYNFYTDNLALNNRINKKTLKELIEVLTLKDKYNKEKLDYHCEKLFQINGVDEMQFFGGVINGNQIDEFWTFAISDFINGQTNQLISGYFTKIEQDAKYDSNNLKNKMKELENKEKDKTEELKKELALISKYKSEGKTLDQIALLLNENPNKKENRYKFFLFRYMNGFFMYFNEFIHNPAIIMNSFAHLMSLYNGIMALFYTNITTNIIKNLKIITNIIVFFKTKEYALKDVIFEKDSEIPSEISDFVTNQANNKFLENINLFTKEAFGIPFFKTSLIELVQQYYNIILGGDIGVDTYFKILKNTFIEEIMHDVDIFITDITTYLLTTKNGEFLNKHLRFFTESLIGKFITYISKLLYYVLVTPTLKKYLIEITPIQNIIPKIDHLFKDQQKFKLTCLFVESKIFNIVKTIPNLFTEKNENSIKILWETLSDILKPGKVTSTLYLPLLVEDPNDFMYGYYRNKEIKPAEVFKGKTIETYEKGQEPYISENPVLQSTIYVDDVINGTPQVINGDIMENMFLEDFLYHNTYGYKVQHNNDDYNILFDNNTNEIIITQTNQNVLAPAMVSEKIKVEYNKTELYKRLLNSTPLNSSLFDDKTYTFDLSSKGNYAEYNVANHNFFKTIDKSEPHNGLYFSFLIFLKDNFDDIYRNDYGVDTGLGAARSYVTIDSNFIDNVKTDFTNFLNVNGISFDDTIISDYITEIHNNPEYCVQSGCENLHDMLSGRKSGLFNNQNSITIDDIKSDLILLSFNDYITKNNINLSNLPPQKTAINDPIDKIIFDFKDQYPFLPNTADPQTISEIKKKISKELKNNLLIKNNYNIYINNKAKLPFYYYYYRYQYNEQQKLKPNLTINFKQFLEEKQQTSGGNMLEMFYIRQMLKEYIFHKDYDIVNDNQVFTKLIGKDEFDEMDYYIKNQRVEIKPIDINKILGENNFLKQFIKYGEPDKNGEYKESKIFINTETYIDTITVLQQYLDILQNTEYVYKNAEQFTTMISNIKSYSLNNPLYMVLLNDIESKIKNIIANFEQQKENMDKDWTKDDLLSSFTFDYEAFDFDYNNFHDFLNKHNYINEDLLKICPQEKDEVTGHYSTNIVSDNDKSTKHLLFTTSDKEVNYFRKFDMFKDENSHEFITKLNFDNDIVYQIDCNAILKKIYNPKLIAEYLDYDNNSSISPYEYSELSKFYYKINPDVLFNGIFESIPYTDESQQFRSFLQYNKHNPKFMKILYTKWRENIVVNGSHIVIDDYDYIDLQKLEHENIEKLNTFCSTLGKDDEDIVQYLPSNVHDEKFAEFIDSSQLEKYKNIALEINKELIFFSALKKRKIDLATMTIEEIQRIAGSNQLLFEDLSKLASQGKTSFETYGCSTVAFKNILRLYKDEYYSEKAKIYKQYRTRKLKKKYANIIDNYKKIEKYLFDGFNVSFNELKTLDDKKNIAILNENQQNLLNQMPYTQGDPIQTQPVPLQSQPVPLQTQPVPQPVSQIQPAIQQPTERGQTAQTQGVSQTQQPALTTAANAMTTQQASKQAEEQSLQQLQAEALQQQQEQLQAEAQSEKLLLQQQLSFSNSDDSFSGFMFGNLMNMLQVITSTETSEYKYEEIIENPALNQLEGYENIREKCNLLSGKWRMIGNSIEFTNADQSEREIISKYCSKKNILYRINEIVLKFLFVDLPKKMRASSTDPNPVFFTIKTIVINFLGENMISFYLHHIIDSVTDNYIRNINNYSPFYKYFFGGLLYYQNCIIYDIKNKPENRTWFNVHDSNGVDNIKKNISRIEEAFGNDFQNNKNLNIFGRIDAGIEVTMFDIITKLTASNTTFFTDKDIREYENSNVNTNNNCQRLKLGLKSSFYAFVKDPTNAFNIIKKVISCRLINQPNIDLLSFVIACTVNFSGTLRNLFILIGDVLKILLGNELTKTFVLDALFGQVNTETSKINYFRNNIESALTNISFADIEKDIDSMLNQYADGIFSVIDIIYSGMYKLLGMGKKYLDIYDEMTKIDPTKDNYTLFEKICSSYINHEVPDISKTFSLVNNNVKVFDPTIITAITNICVNLPINYDEIFKKIFQVKPDKTLDLDISGKPKFNYKVLNPAFVNLFNTAPNYQDEISEVFLKCYNDYEIRKTSVNNIIQTTSTDNPNWILGLLPLLTNKNYSSIMESKHIFTYESENDKIAYIAYDASYVKVNNIEKDYNKNTFSYIYSDEPVTAELKKFGFTQNYITDYIDFYRPEHTILDYVTENINGVDIVKAIAGPATSVSLIDPIVKSKFFSDVVNPIVNSNNFFNKVNPLYQKTYWGYFSKIHLEYYKKTFVIEDIEKFIYDYKNFIEPKTVQPDNRGNPLYHLKIRGDTKNRTFYDIYNEGKNKDLLEELLNPFSKAVKGLNIDIKCEKVTDPNDPDDWYMVDTYGKYNFIDDKSKLGTQLPNNLCKISINLDSYVPSDVDISTVQWFNKIP